MFFNLNPILVPLTYFSVSLFFVNEISSNFHQILVKTLSVCKLIHYKLCSCHLLLQEQLGYLRTGGWVLRAVCTDSE